MCLMEYEGESIMIATGTPPGLSALAARLLDPAHAAAEAATLADVVRAAPDGDPHDVLLGHVRRGRAELLTALAAALRHDDGRDADETRGSYDIGSFRDVADALTAVVAGSFVTVTKHPEVTGLAVADVPLASTARSGGVGAPFTTLTVEQGTRTVRFEGRWLVEADVEDDWGDQPGPEHARPTADCPAPPESWRSWIGETARGRIVVYSHHWAFDEATTTVFEVFDTLDAARAALGDDPRFRAWLWDRAAQDLARRPTVTWLDI